MAININPRMSVKEYFEWELQNEFKHEYIDGEIYEMTGGSGKHSKIPVNISFAVLSQIDRSSYVMFNSEMRIKVSETRFVYPDLSAVRGEEAYEDESELTLLNPVFVVEVTSPSSMVYDRVDKLGFYLDVPSIKEYLIVDQDRVRADLYTRSEDGWLLRVCNQLEDVIPLSALKCELPLTQIYDGIVFEKA